MEGAEGSGEPLEVGGEEEAGGCEGVEAEAGTGAAQARGREADGGDGAQEGAQVPAWCGRGGRWREDDGGRGWDVLGDRLRRWSEECGGDGDVLFVGDGGVVVDGGDEVGEGAGDGSGGGVGVELEGAEVGAAVGEDEGEEELGVVLTEVDEGAQRAVLGGGDGFAVADEGDAGEAEADRPLELGARGEVVAAEDRHADARRGALGGGAVACGLADGLADRSRAGRLLGESRRVRQRQQGQRDRRPRWGHGGPVYSRVAAELRGSAAARRELRAFAAGRSRTSARNPPSGCPDRGTRCTALDNPRAARDRAGSP